MSTVSSELAQGVLIGLRDAFTTAEKRAEAHQVLDQPAQASALLAFATALREKHGAIEKQEAEKEARRRALHGTEAPNNGDH
jgi:2-polyprenyl-6-methoxyphenol hydroxylase-like FAD-dependent oxidoreductase